MNDTILVVYSGYGSSKPIMLDSSGNLNSVKDAFTFGDETGSLVSCSATINGRMMIFGGFWNTKYKNQISVVESCQLTRVGDLPMSFHGGACNTFTWSGKEETLLCFAGDVDLFRSNLPSYSTCHR